MIDDVITLLCKELITSKRFVYAAANLTDANVSHIRHGTRKLNLRHIAMWSAWSGIPLHDLAKLGGVAVPLRHERARRTVRGLRNCDVPAIDQMLRGAVPIDPQ